MEDAVLARLVVERGLAPLEPVRALLARRQAGDPRPLRELLVLASLVRPEVLAQLETVATPATRASASQRLAPRPAPTAPVPAGPAPTVADRSAPPLDPDASRRAAESAVAAELARLLEADPLFSPLADLTLERERKLGEGGMGVVHLVRDKRLGRRAALKLIRGNASETRIRRFLREASVTARLDHPGIPPVHEVGRTASGEHFMLLRFVDGESLEAILASSPPRPRHELLAILVKVGEAVAFAHSRRVVHRDLKPANVMVGAFGEVLVLDWGLARNMDESAGEDAALRAAEEAAPLEQGPALTRAGTALGTLGYMPPEQARGDDVDGRADVYALGAILTEILTGRPPIEADSFAAGVVQTIDGAVELPRARDPSCPPELDAIAARALATDPGARYPTAQAVTEDVRAYLEGRPVSVHRYGALGQARLLARRHPTVFATGALAILLGAAAAVVLGLKNRDLRRTLLAYESEKAGREAAEARSERAAKARRLLEDARTLLRQGAPPAVVRGVAQDAVETSREESVLLAAGKLLAGSGDPEPARKILRACADEFPPAYEALLALHELDASREDWKSTPALEELVARARARGEENEFTVMAAAEEAMARKDPAAALEAALRATKLAPRFAGAWVLAAEAKQQANDYAGEIDLATKAIEVDGTLASAFDARSFALGALGRLREAADDSSRAIALAPNRAYGWGNRGAFRLAQDDYEGAIADLERAVALAPTGGGWLGMLGLARAKGKHDYARAMEECARAVELAPRSSSALINLVVVEMDAGEPRKAFDHAQRALALDPKRAIAWDLSGDARRASGDVAGAIADYEKCLELDPKHGEAWASLGIARCEQGDRERGIACLDKALALAPGLVAAWFGRARARSEQGQLAAAIGDLDCALWLDPKREDAWLLRGEAHFRLRRWDLAAEDADRLIALRPKNGSYVNLRGSARFEGGDVEGGLADFTKAIELDPGYAGSWANRVEAWLAKGELAKAEADADKAIALAPKFAFARREKALVRRARGDRAGALAALAEAIELEPGLVDARTTRAEIHLDAGALDEAVADLDRAILSEPDAAEAWRLRGLARAAQGKRAEAIADLEKFLALVRHHDQVALVRQRLAELKRAGSP